MLSSLTFDNNKEKFTNWRSTGMSPEKIKLFDSSLAPIISNLGNYRIILKFDNFLSV